MELIAKLSNGDLTLFIPSLFGWCSTWGGGGGEGGVFVKSDDSNFVQNYFGDRVNILGQEKSGSNRY